MSRVQRFNFEFIIFVAIKSDSLQHFFDSMFFKLSLFLSSLSTVNVVADVAVVVVAVVVVVVAVVVGKKNRRHRRRQFMAPKLFSSSFRSQQLGSNRS